MTGVAGLKAQKRKKEIDDIWDLMNQEDSYYKKAAKVQKTSENQRIPPTVVEKTK